MNKDYNKILYFSIFEFSRKIEPSSSDTKWSGGKIVLGYKSSSTKKTKKKGRRMMNNNNDMKNKNNKYKGTRNLNDKYLRIR